MSVPYPSLREDYSLLPFRVFPTPLRALERNGACLFLLHLEYRKPLSRAQDQLLRAATARGRAPRPHTALVLWGNAAVSGMATPRAMLVYEQGEVGEIEETSDDRIREWIRDWFRR